MPEDFVRNFLRNAGLQRTAEAFEMEWYEVRQGRTYPALLFPTHPAS